MRCVRLGFVSLAVVVLLLSTSSSGLAAVPTPGLVSVPGAHVGLTTDELRLPSGAAVRPLPPGARITLTLTLSYSNPNELSALLAAVEDPASPDYRHFLTAPEFAEEFGPSPATVRATTSALAAAGGTDITVSGSRAVVSAVMPVGGVEDLLGVSLVAYGSHDGYPLYTAVGTPRLPPALAQHVVGIGGLTNGLDSQLSFGTRFGELRPVRAPAAPQFVLSNTSQEWFLGSDFTQAYGATSLFPNGTVGSNGTFPTRVAVATLLASGYNESSNQNLPGFDPTVVQAYFNDSFPTSWPEPTVAGVPVMVDGVSAPPPQSFGTLNDSSLDEFENSLDLEMAGSLAPGASLYNFYFAGSLLAGSTPLGDLADYFADDLGAALTYNYSPAHLAVVSGSFGLPDLNDSAWDADLTEAAATGVTVVMSSGDQGNAPDSLTGRNDGPWPDWPASAAFNVSGSVSVGGVSISLDGVPTTVWNGTSLNVTFDANLTGIGSMSAWWDANGCPSACSGTEGGLSTEYPEPFWQFHSAAQPAIANAAVTQGTKFLGRAGPDVAFPANDTIAYVYANSSESVYFTVLEGTSVSAPIFAGLLADVVAVENRSGSDGGLGYLDPELYRTASYYAANPGPATPFLDVTSGANYVFSAGPGWDATTGWGGVQARLFLAADENPVVQSFEYTGPTPGIPSTSPPPVPDVAIYVILGLAVVLAVLIALVFAWPARGPETPPLPRPPGGTYGLPPPPPPSQYGLPPPAPATLGRTTASFLCPYCGSPRPAEPVRCPRCGAL
jgi:subtilase family serine protease